MAREKHLLFGHRVLRYEPPRRVITVTVERHGTEGYQIRVGGILGETFETRAALDDRLTDMERSSGPDNRLQVIWRDIPPVE